MCVCVCLILTPIRIMWVASKKRDPPKKDPLKTVLLFLILLFSAINNFSSYFPHVLSIKSVRVYVRRVLSSLNGKKYGRMCLKKAT